MNIQNLKNPLLDQILTPPQYEKMHYGVPYILNLKNNKQELLYYGTEHSKDQQDKKFDEIESLFKDFTVAHSADKIIVALESMVPPEVLSRDEMIEKYRETGFLMYLAHRHSIRVISPEPGDKIMPLVKLFGGYSVGVLAGWMLAGTLVYKSSAQPLAVSDLIDTFRIIDASIGYGLLPSIVNEEDAIKIIEDKYISVIREQFQLETGSNLVPPMLNSICADYKSLDLNTLKNVLDRSKEKNIFHKISSDFSNVRDRYIARGILDELQKRNSVFAVFGTNHVIAQEPAFKKYFSLS